MKHENIYKLTLTALMAALSYVIFTFLQIQLNLLIPKKSGTPDGARSFFFIIFYFNVRNRFAFLSAGRSAM